MSTLVLKKMPPNVLLEIRLAKMVPLHGIARFSSWVRLISNMNSRWLNSGEFTLVSNGVGEAETVIESCIDYTRQIQGESHPNSNHWLQGLLY